MAVATKSRRKVTVEGKQYVWYVAENGDGPGMVLHVISPDKQFIVKYQVDQPTGEEYVVVIGPRFSGAETGGPWKRFLCPRFAENAVTPSCVRELIQWCLNEHLTRQEIDCRSHSLIL